MKALVLLSEGRHPVSGAPCLPRTEAQAVRLAAGLDPAAAGLHAGPQVDAVCEALGRGLRRLTHLRLAAQADPLSPLAAAIRQVAPDLVLAGARGEGGTDMGLLPYAIAHALSWPLVADAIALEPGVEPSSLRIMQALPRGARRRILVRLPVLVTVHTGAAAPLPFAYGKARAGTVSTAVPAVSVAAQERSEERIEAGMENGIEERPYRRRSKVLVPAVGQPATKGEPMIHPDPHEAALEILAFLRATGVFKGRD